MTSAISPGSRVDVQRAGLDPRHVEQVADEPVQAVGLRGDVVDELAPDGLVELHLGVAERC